MSTRPTDDLTDDGQRDDQPTTYTTVESYETDDGVVLYDAENPLAWMETSRPVPLDEIA